MQFPDAVLGPLGALALALAVMAALGRAVQVLWRDHLASDRDDRDQRDKAHTHSLAALEVSREQVNATNRLAEGLSRVAGDVAEIRRIVERLDK